MPMNSLVHVGQGRFTNSVAVRPRSAPAAPAVLQMLAQSIATLNEKVDALALRADASLAQSPVRSQGMAVRHRPVPSFELFDAEDAGLDDPGPVAAPPVEQPRVNRGLLHVLFD